MYLKQHKMDTICFLNLIEIGSGDNRKKTLTLLIK